MSYEVVLDEFQGPLDLLLHLIKEKEMDLESLEVSVITDQYLAYIDQMDPDQLETMSEYLVMAAQLIEMKSKLLLPNEKVELEDDYQEDPREQLIRRLIEYKKYKDVLDEFRDCYEHRQTLHTKAPALMDDYIVDTTEMIPQDLEVYDLIRAMQKMFQRKALMAPLESKIARVEISIEDRSDQIRQYFRLHKNQRVDFEELFDEPSRTFFVVTFLSILVLVNTNELVIEQEGNFEKIYLKERN
ncbi:MAG: segregation/condensation protein A [Coprobacillus cateniformis]|uniref:Segregation and condensation protein A n=1 Tax=Longibaculum muris TaxID=1796628 RepID=A0A4R3ZAD9_9FIRM|nr:segregation/condensation protein A [Longibaculum muris]MBS5111435.1 segregation/condensation protein A [Coprobacillus cateniformis]MBS5369222.1 segregation/condensation protein A [Coprobacillus cateniformis]MCR1886801.1 segregation/condensation protein A [Longibaculum muris]MED9810540.1 segregation/condensation protein A [Longibaculum muris]TCW02831.1 condensin subunit ScpA [Longibaculum muris]